MKFKQLTPLILSACALFFFIWGQLGRLSFSTEQINVYIYEIILFLLLGTFIVRDKLKPLLNARDRFGSLLYFLMYLALSFIFLIPNFNFYENTVSFFYLVRLALYFLLFIYFISYVSEKKHSKFFQYPIVAASCFVIMVLSFIQYFLYPDIRNIMYLGWDPHLYRMVGVFLEPPVAGAIYGLFFLYFLDNSSINRVIRINFLIILGIAILLTYSRIIYLGFALTVAFWLLKRMRVMTAVAFIAVFILGIIVIPKPFGESVNLFRMFTVESRLRDYHDAVSIWQKYPVLGVGYNRLRYIKSQSAEFDISSHAAASYHSSFMIILVTGGIIGLGLFIKVLWDLGRLGSFSKYGVIFLSIASLGDNIILHPFILFLFFMLLIISHPLSKSP